MKISKQKNKSAKKKAEEAKEAKEAKRKRDEVFREEKLALKKKKEERQEEQSKAKLELLTSIALNMKQRQALAHIFQKRQQLMDMVDSMEKSIQLKEDEFKCY